MKQFTNQMCRKRGLTVAEKGKHFDGSEIEKAKSLHGTRINITCSDNMQRTVLWLTVQWRS